MKPHKVPTRRQGLAPERQLGRQAESGNEGKRKQDEEKKRKVRRRNESSGSA
jgi:hypothetical protein